MSATAWAVTAADLAQRAERRADRSEVVVADEELVERHPEARIVAHDLAVRVELGGVLAHRHVAGLAAHCDCTWALVRNLM